MTRSRFILALVLLFSLSSACFAEVEVPDPREAVGKTAERVLAELARDRDRYQTDDAALYDMARRLVVSQFDLERTAQWVLARHWRGATAEQRQQFEDEFSRLMLRTYALALRSYDNETIEYLPLVMKPGSKKVMVKTKLVRDDGSKVTVDYRLILREDGWKVYDVVIENVSMVITYRSEYSGIIESQGLDVLTQKLSERNRAALEK